MRHLTIMGGYKKGERFQADTSPYGLHGLLQFLCGLLRCCPGLVHLKFQISFTFRYQKITSPSCSGDFADLARDLCALRNLKAFTCRSHGFAGVMWTESLLSNIWHKLHHLDIDMLGVCSDDNPASFWPAIEPSRSQLRSLAVESLPDDGEDRSVAFSAVMRIIRTSPAIEHLFVGIDLHPDSFATILPELPLLAHLKIRLDAMPYPNVESVATLRDALHLRDSSLDFRCLGYEFGPLGTILPALPKSLETLALHGLGDWHPDHWVFNLYTIAELVASPSWCPRLESIEIDVSSYRKYGCDKKNESYEDPDDDYSIGKRAMLAAMEESEARKGVLQISFIE